MRLPVTDRDFRAQPLSHGGPGPRVPSPGPLVLPRLADTLGSCWRSPGLNNCTCCFWSTLSQDGTSSPSRAWLAVSREDQLMNQRTKSFSQAPSFRPGDLQKLPRSFSVALSAVSMKSFPGLPGRPSVAPARRARLPRTRRRLVSAAHPSVSDAQSATSPTGLACRAPSSVPWASREKPSGGGRGPHAGQQWGQKEAWKRTVFADQWLCTGVFSELRGHWSGLDPRGQGLFGQGHQTEV